MSRVQLALNVNDIEEAVGFYTKRWDAVRAELDRAAPAASAGECCGGPAAVSSNTCCG